MTSCNLITFGVEKARHDRTFKQTAFKTNTALFLSRYGLSLYLHLRSQRNILAHIQFLELVSTNRSIMTLTLQHNESQSFLPFKLSDAVSDTLNTSLPCNLWSLWQYHCRLAVIKSSRLHGHTSGHTSVHTHVQLSSVCHITHVIKCSRFTSSLAGRAWERG